MSGAKDESKYFNFPVELLQNLLIDKRTALNNIFNYAVCAHASKLEFGNKLNKFKDSLKFFGVISGNNAKSMESGELLLDSILDDGAKVGISKEIWFDYYKNEKTEFEIVQLLAFLAIKSIVKYKPYASITNAFMLARMDGKGYSVKEYTDLSKEIFKYANEYQTKKIKRALSESWGLITYSYRLHGFYVSFTLSLDELVLIAERNRKKNKDLAAKKASEDARKKALATIYGTPLRE